MPATLSVVLITLNEAANLPRTLASVQGLGEIIVVDSGSTDATVATARQFGARVFIEDWKGFGAQKNSAIAKAAGDWILSLDADEEVSRELAGEIQALLAAPVNSEAGPAMGAYRIPRLNHFLGVSLHHGGYWPDAKLRLFRRGVALFENRPVHETMQVTGRANGSAGQVNAGKLKIGLLKGHLIHYCYPTMEEYIEHMNRYSTAGAQMLVDAGRSGQSWAWLVWNAVLNPAATFLYNYVFRLGFLDGRAGLLQHINHSMYIHWKFAKAWERARITARVP